MKIINFKTLPSTNQYLKEHYQELEEFTIIKADNQTNGHGRLNRSWQVEPNTNLTFSILLKPKVDSSIIPLISLVAGSSVFKTLDKYVKCTIKWPNDIMIKDKKVTGILAEGVYSNTMEALIIGIGINVNQTIFNEEIKNKATSLKLELYRDLNIDTLLQEFWVNFEWLYNNYINGNNTYIKICKEHNYLKDKVVTYDNKEVKVLDISDNGNLEVLENNQIKELFFGEVTLQNIYHK